MFLGQYVPHIVADTSNKKYELLIYHESNVLGVHVQLIIDVVAM